MAIGKKVTVAYFVPNYRGAGMARWVMGIVDTINTKEYEVSFVGLSIQESFMCEISQNVRLVNLGNSRVPGIFLKLVAYFRKEHPDIFISAFPHINVVSMMAKIVSGIGAKVILTEHNHFSLLAGNAGSIWRRFFGLRILPHVMRLIYPLSDTVICVSNGVAQSILDIVDVKDKVKVIYNLVVGDALVRLLAEPLSHPWFLDAGTPVILAAGRLVNQKDYPMLLRAFALVVQKRPVRLVILGEGPEQKKLEQIASELEISQDVTFLGFQKNPFTYMKHASVFVLSSLHEGFGNVIVEAMACGTPVVSTDCKSGPGEIIENGKNGILVPVGDYQSLAKAITDVLGNPSLRQKLSLEGKRRSEDFSVQKGMRQYEEVFKQVMGKK